MNENYRIKYSYSFIKGRNTNDNKNLNIDSYKDLLTILISIFYFEKFKEDSFIPNKYNYYLINANWLQKFKEYYNYQEIYNYLNSLEDKYSHINYDNLYNCMEDILKDCSLLDIENKEINKELLIIKIESVTNKYYIIHSKILNLIKKIGYENNIKINKKEIFKKGVNNYFLIDNNGKDILVGNINNDLIFITKYNLHYKTPEILNQEKTILLEKSIEEYISMRNCKDNIINKQQYLIKEAKGMIGDLTIFNIKHKNNNEFKHKRKIETNILIDIQKNNYIRYNNLNAINNVKNKQINRIQSITPIKYSYRTNNYNTNKDYIKKRKSTSNNKRNNNNLNYYNNTQNYFYPRNKDYNNMLDNKNNILNNRNNNLSTRIHQINNNKENKRIENENELMNQNELNKIIHNKNNGQENMIYQLNQEINKLKMDNKNKDNEIIMLKNYINEEYQNSINQLQNEIKRLQNENKEIREENTKLKNELNNNKIFINKLENEKKKKENIIKSLEINNNNKKEEFENMLKEKENEINNIKIKLNKNIEKEENILKDNEILKEKNLKIQSELNNQIILNENYLNKINKLEIELKELTNHKIKRIKIKKDIELSKVLRKQNSDLNINKNELKEEINKMNNNTHKVKKNNFNKINNNTILEDNISLNNIYDYSSNQNINIILENEPIVSYCQPTLVGLDNIEATSFMNATLQCLSQTEELTNFFLNKNNREIIINNNKALNNKNEIQLSPVFYELINKLWEVNGPKSFSPINFTNILNQINPLFENRLEENCKNFIIFILEQLHNELKKPNNFNNKDNIKEILNQSNGNNAFLHIFNEFIKETSIISDIFFGFNEITNECLNCKNKNLQGNSIFYNYEIFNYLIFPLNEIKKKKNTKNNCNILNNNNYITIYDCFDYNQRNVKLEGDNKMVCNKCKEKCEFIYNSKIYISPNILILILIREEENKYDVKLDFTETIDITSFIPHNEVSQITYDLYGVITNIDKSGLSDHFISLCKSPVNSKWYRYNNSIVSYITNIKEDVIDFGTPYILFYQKNID